MKKLNVLVGVVCSALILSLGACKKKDNSNPAMTNGSATITGQVKAVLDDTQPNPSNESAPDGTVILAQIYTKDLVYNPSNNTTYANKVYSTTVSGGTYKFSIDANAENVTVTIMPQDFTHDWTHVISSGDTTQMKTYTASQFTVDVVNGSNKVKDISYTHN